MRRYFRLLTQYFIQYCKVRLAYRGDMVVSVLTTLIATVFGIGLVYLLFRRAPEQRQSPPCWVQAMPNVKTPQEPCPSVRQSLSFLIASCRTVYRQSGMAIGCSREMQDTPAMDRRASRCHSRSNAACAASLRHHKGLNDDALSFRVWRRHPLASQVDRCQWKQVHAGSNRRRHKQ